MELSTSAFEDLHPGRRLEFRFPLRALCHDAETEGQEAVVSVVVLDSELGVDERSAQCAAMLVPLGREEDWIYSTEGGQWQLLASAAVCRMILFSCYSANSQPQEIVRRFGGSGGQNETTIAMHNHNQEASSDRQPSRKPADDGSRTSCSSSEEFLKGKLSRLVLALVPKILFQHGLPDVPFVSYTDNVVHRIVLEECSSPLTGSMVVEDVELRQGDFEVELERSPSSSATLDTCHHGRGECCSRKGEPRQCKEQSHITEKDASGSKSRAVLRRLRFKRMPNLIQTEVRVLKACAAMGSQAMATSIVDHGVLVHKYLAPIVAGLVLVSPCLEACTASGRVASVLCIGVGGGALPSFLHKHFPFRIQAVDLDEVVLRLARQHFGLMENDSLQVKACDGLNFVEDVAETVVKMGLVPDSVAQTWQQLTRPTDKRNPGDSLYNFDSSPDAAVNSMACSGADPRLHLIVVDVDTGDPKLDLSSPPKCFLSKPFLFSALISLHHGGMLAMNVVPHNLESFELVVSALKQVFPHVYAVDVEDDINQVVFALTCEPLGMEVVGSISSLVRKLVGTNLVERIYRL